MYCKSYQSMNKTFYFLAADNEFMKAIPSVGFEVVIGSINWGLMCDVNFYYHEIFVISILPIKSELLSSISTNHIENSHELI